MSKVSEFARDLRSDFFADRPSVNAAYEYANKVAKGTDNPAAVMTAVQVVVNTIAKHLETLENKKRTTTVTLDQDDFGLVCAVLHGFKGGTPQATKRARRILKHMEKLPLDPA